jgi:hypothetical protein
MPKKLDRNKAIPREGLNQVRHKGAQRVVFDKPIPDEMFEQAGNEYDGPIKGRLEQDRTDQRRTIVVADRSRRVGDQHRFSDNERRSRRQHKAPERDIVLGEEQVRRQPDRVEADKEEDRRRQDFAKLVQQKGAGTTQEAGRCRDPLAWEFHFHCAAPS